MTRIVPPQGGALRLPLAQFPELGSPSGAVRVRPSAAEPVLHVLALGGGRYAAVSSVCTHLGCAVEVEGDRLVCPCHGSTYDREGRVLKGPAERALARYATTVTDDHVVVVELGGASR
jgi:Rieske Fe-S protein